MKITACEVWIRQPLWSSGQSSWLHIQRFRFDSRRYQIFWEIVGLERGPLSLVSTIEEILGRKNSNSSLWNREYGRMDPSRCPRCTQYPQTFALTSPTRGSRSVGIVHSRTQATEFSLVLEMWSHVLVCWSNIMPPSGLYHEEKAISFLSNISMFLRDYTNSNLNRNLLLLCLV
jgi:hypothetical protein